MDTLLRDLAVLVTGASGGIGRATADAFAREGCRLALHAHTGLDALRAWADESPSRAGAFCGQADLCHSDQSEALVGDAVAALGRLDVCVINAGIWPPESVALHELAPERIEAVLTTNLLSAMWTARAFLRAVARTGPRADGRGVSICLVGSTAGRFGEAGHTPYAVSKAGMYGLLRSLKNEIVALDRYGRVNLVEPGWTATPMAADALATPGHIEQALATVPIRQLARAEDIAASILYLSSPALARHVSGEVITVSGGMEGRRLWTDDDIDPEAVRQRLRS
ncbi:MAG: 3-oxoacyl-[acyl-carrier-protein] reductase [Haliangiales bacterium]